MKSYVIGGVVALAGFLVWRLYNSAQTGSYAMLPGAGQGTFSTQPSASYPFIANQAPRVDNSNQPWYGGDRAPLMSGNPDLSGLSGTAKDASSIQSIVASTTNIWNDLGVGDWFSSSEPSDTSSSWF